MKTTITIIGSVTCLLVASAALHAQQFSLLGKDVQVHGFASQGFAYSNQNNYLTMKTSNGSFAFTDVGVNVSARITKNFRVGAQFYDRNLGELGNWHPQVDWAFGDYKFSDKFGIRVGKVKTAFGLFNDTQDMEFLHTWAILPQSLYPMDLRANVIAHTGGDAYGELSLRKAGSLSYTAYAGTRTNDTRGGYYYGTADKGVNLSSFTGISAGGDVRWNTSIQGLMVGGSWMNQTADIRGTVSAYGLAPVAVTNDTQKISAVYADFVRGNWHFNTEFRKDNNIYDVAVMGTHSPLNQGSKGWFASAAYRITKKLEVGAYNSRFYVDAPSIPDPAATHIFDQTITARYDISKFWNVKVEGHFIDGNADVYSAHGFYLGANPAGLKPTTKMLVVRTGFNF